MIGIIVQARMSSTRLPGKVMKRILGKTLLEHLVLRLRRVKSVDRVLVATTIKRTDDAIVRALKRLRVPFFRGSENDVLDRYYQAAGTYGLTDIVRVTGDCPVIDPAVIDRVVGFYKKNKKRFDYVSNVNPPTFPDGMDVEVFSFNALETAWKKARLTSEREHVTPYIRNHPRVFRIGNVRAAKDFSHLRLTVDEPRDLALMKKVFVALYPRKHFFTLADMLDLFAKNPKLLGINQGIMRNEGLLKSLKEDKLFRSRMRSNK